MHITLTKNMHMSVFLFVYFYLLKFSCQNTIFIFILQYTMFIFIILYYNKIIIIKLRKKYAYHINKNYAHECFLFIYFYLVKFSCQNTIFLFFIFKCQ